MARPLRIELADGYYRFHLLVHTARANLSEFMRHFQVTYTVRFNRRNRRSGHVFQGRFKSLNGKGDVVD
jgi:hypothetical protein